MTQQKDLADINRGSGLSEVIAKGRAEVRQG